MKNWGGKKKSVFKIRNFSQWFSVEYCYKNFYNYLVTQINKSICLFTDSTNFVGYHFKLAKCTEHFASICHKV